MAAPYVSSPRLRENSFAAMLAAIELYNKPQITYREETTVILLINAWELLAKSILRKHKKSVFYPKEIGQPRRSLTLKDALSEVTRLGLWPEGISGDAVKANIEALLEYRNQAIHLYSAGDLAQILHLLMQQCVVNYRDVSLAWFGKDLADDISWQLLPLSPRAPSETVRFLSVDPAARGTKAVESFVADLRQVVAAQEESGSDMTRVAATYKIHLQSAKALKSSDLSVAVDKSAGSTVLIKPSDPNNTHPFTTTQLLERANKSRSGRKLNSHDFKVICWKEDLRDNPKFAWKHASSVSNTWSGDAVHYFKSLDDATLTQARKEYREYRRST